MQNGVFSINIRQFYEIKKLRGKKRLYTWHYFGKILTSPILTFRPRCVSNECSIWFFGGLNVMCRIRGILEIRDLRTRRLLNPTPHFENGLTHGLLTHNKMKVIMGEGYHNTKHP
jgi:hypothetical protein